MGWRESFALAPAFWMQHAQDVPQTRDASRWRTHIFSLTVPEPRGMVLFPGSLELQFTAHSLLLYQASQEHSKTRKLKHKVTGLGG